ncbi:MAG: lysine transporter LysE [Caulobacterales bacterium 32-69-10]|nr:MAG: lysine transporter LysE [Caulobacterales bacterium 32-69-10]
MDLPVDPSRWLAFLGVMAAMAFFPGPANLFCVATGMARGRTAALAAMVGMNAATLVWYGAAAVGLGALVAAFPAAFKGLRLVGALYLVWMGIGAMRAALSRSPAPPAAAIPRPGSDLRNGFAVQIANPKIILFFSAVLPPFLDLDRPLPGQLLVFAATMIAMDAAAMTTFGLGGAALARRMESPRFRRGFSAVTALLLFAAAALVAISG